MCAVNDAKREAIQLKIDNYNSEKVELEKMRTKVEKAFYQNIEALQYADCVTNNLSGINLGGNKTIDDMKECKKNIKERKEFFEKQLKTAVAAIKTLENSIADATKEYNNIPKDCGSCEECCPPSPTTMV